VTKPSQSDLDIDTLRAELSLSKQELARTQEELLAYKRSPVWKLYGLVRQPLSLLRRVISSPTTLKAKVARIGGQTQLLALIKRQIHQFGLFGFFQYLLVRAFKANTKPAPGSGVLHRDDYPAWFAQHRRSLSKTFNTANGVLLSVVIPVYRPDLALFKQAIESVLKQTYANWELCIADDASNDPELSSYLQQLSAQHNNIHVLFREQNGHIAACTNSALTMVSGDFVVLFDQDDLLPTHALDTVAHYIARHPNAGILYSDEDRIDATGQTHLSAYFKPDFDYDLFLGQNMVSHLGVYRTSLVHQVGGFRSEYSGSQDWDLALRVLELIEHHQVVHIPQVLYHWRAIEGSTALSHSAKTYAMTASRQAIQSHLDRTGQKGRVRPASLHPSYNRVEYELPSAPLKASILCLTQASSPPMESVVQRLLHHPGRHIDITSSEVIQDNLSLQHQVQNLASSASDLVVLVSAYCSQVPDCWLEDLARIALQPRCGFVAPRILDSSPKHAICDHGGILFSDKKWATFSHKGVPSFSPGYTGRNMLQQRFTALSPALLVIRRDLLLSMVNPSTDWLMGPYLTLLDWQLQLNQEGHSNLWAPEIAFHINDLSQCAPLNVFWQDTISKTALDTWFARWGEQPNDPAYNPNLSPDGDFSLNWRLGQRSE